MDFAIGQENSVLNLPDRQVKFFWGENSNYRKTVLILFIKIVFFFGLQLN